MKKTAYTYAVLRYVHDVRTEEFLNVGVVLFAPEAKYLDAICIAKYGRLSKMFYGSDGEHFKRVGAYIQHGFKLLGERFKTEFRFEEFSRVNELLGKVLPFDDSAFQFGREGSGITDNPQRELQELYLKFCEKYTEKQLHSRSEDDVWRVFRQPLEDRGLIGRLKPITIKSDCEEIEFKHAWKNGSWHVLQPVSFDLVDPRSITDKATLWLGRGHTILDPKNTRKEYKEGFKMCFLLGLPGDKKMMKYFERAKHILEEMPIQKEFYFEDKVNDFAKKIESEMKASHAEVLKKSKR